MILFIELMVNKWIYVRDFGVRLVAVQGIGKLPNRRDALPALNRALNDPDPRVQQAASQVLEDLGELPPWPGFKKRPRE